MSVSKRIASSAKATFIISIGEYSDRIFLPTLHGRNGDILLRMKKSQASLLGESNTNQYSPDIADVESALSPALNDEIPKVIFNASARNA